MVRITTILIVVAIVGFVAFGGISASKTAFGELKKEGKNLKSYTQKKIDQAKKGIDEIQKKNEEAKDKV